jgi:hypothetical protein
VPDSDEYSIKFSDSIKVREFLDQLSYNQLLKDLTVWSYLCVMGSP